VTASDNKLQSLPMLCFIMLVNEGSIGKELSELLPNHWKPENANEL
jgi:hypothetical protein